MSWNQIPCVSGVEPLDGHFQEFRTDLLGLLRRAAMEGGQRPIRLSVGSIPFLILNNPAAVEQILTDPARIFFKPKMDLWRRVLGDSVLTSSGEQWLRARKRTLPFLGPLYVERHARIVSEMTDDRVRSWLSGDTIDVLHEMRFITLSSSLRSLFGIDPDLDVPAFSAALTEVMEYIHVRATSTPGAETDEALERRFLAALSELRESVARIVGIDPGGTDDPVSILLASPDFQSGRLSVTQVCDDVLAHLIASSESTATALAWSFFLIAQSPAVENRLREEIVHTVGNRRPDIPDLSRMLYLHGVFGEALRLYPPTWGILRASERAFELDGVRLPKGTCTLACQYTIHRDGLWFERPGEFIPERWLDGALARIPRFAFFPFGGGRRLCPGRRMGKVTAYTVVSRVLQQFRVDAVAGCLGKAAVHATLHPVSGTSVQVTQLRTSHVS